MFNKIIDFQVRLAFVRRPFDLVLQVKSDGHSASSFKLLVKALMLSLCLSQYVVVVVCVYF